MTDTPRSVDDEAGAQPAPGGEHRIDPDVLRLGLVSLLTDLSSEIVFAVFPIVFTTVAHASTTLLGLVEGLADFAASSLGWWSGRLADASGRYKRHTLAGYAFSTAAKALLLLASSAAVLATFRIVERLGKGFRGPPRDAWLAAVATRRQRGFAFGVHRALDKAGAVAGPLLAWALLRTLGASESSYRLLFAIAFVPALVAVLVLAAIPARPGEPRSPPRSGTGDAVPTHWRTLDAPLRRWIAVASLFSLGYFSVGFLLLRASGLGFSADRVVLLYALSNAVCVITAPVVGRLGDHFGRRALIAFGYACYGTVLVTLAIAASAPPVVAAFALHGVFYAIDESQAKAYVVDLAPTERATALGAYGFFTGVLYVVASLAAGLLWTIDPRLALGAAAAVAFVAVVALLRVRAA